MNQSNSAQDRRQHPRFEGNIPLKISSEECDVVTETKNISRTGAYCRVNKYIEPMTKLKIHLLVPLRRNNKVVTKKLSFNGVVVRAESIPATEDFNIAIFFNDIRDKDADSITDYINALLSKNSKA